METSKELSQVLIPAKYEKECLWSFTFLVAKLLLQHKAGLHLALQPLFPRSKIYASKQLSIQLKETFIKTDQKQNTVARRVCCNPAPHAVDIQDAPMAIATYTCDASWGRKER